MGIIRPATPGFLITLLATALLAVVSFSVPYFKSVFFLKASLRSEGINGSITFGTLGYCLQLPNGTTCSKPSVGYELDINALVGDNSSIQIPNVVVKWITYTLVLHIVALILAAISAFFGLLAHVREMSMSCMSSCISGFGASIALLAFIFDLAFFFIAKSRINSVEGGSAAIGTGIWLTLAAWICLFFAGCFFGVGRACIKRRSGLREPDGRMPPPPESSYAEQMRLEAIKAEADRKARQKQGDIALPALPETEPLTKGDTEEIYVDDGDRIVAYQRPGSQSPPTPGAGTAGVGAGIAAYARQGAAFPGRQQSPYAGGYAQAPPGTRAVDNYYNNAPPQAGNVYPPPPRSPPQQQPNPRRQASSRTQASGYAPSPYGTSPAPPMPSANLGLPGAQYAGSQYAHNQYASAATTAQDLGHSRQTTYQSAASHAQYPTNYSNQYPEQPETFNPDTYNNTGYMQPGVAAYPSTTPYPRENAPQYPQPYAQPASSPSPAHQTPERSYTLGGGGYGSSTVPVLHEPQHDDTAAYYAQQHNSHMPSPYSPLPTPMSSHIHTDPSSPVAAAGTSAGLRSMSPEQPMYEDSPPMYDDATAQPPGEWSTKQPR